ncbi:MAG: hypothetical protein ACXWTU_03795 [Methylotenera sp.]
MSKKEAIQNRIGALQDRMGAIANDKEYLKKFDSEVLAYEFTVSEIKRRGLRFRAEWLSLGIGKQLYVRMEALEGEPIPGYWSDGHGFFRFPVDEIPRVIDELKKILSASEGLSDD